MDVQYSCDWLENQIYTLNDTIMFCCQRFENVPKVKINVSDSNEAVRTIIDTRQSIIAMLNGGVKKSNHCLGCPFVVKKFNPAKYKIKTLNIADFGVCNLNCIYCSHHTKNNNKTELPYLDYPMFLQTLINLGIADENLNVTLVCDEISVHPKYAEILSTFKDYIRHIDTNALIFRDELKEVLEDGKNKSFLRVSVDSGTKETFARIKGRDAFEKVRKNLKKYSDGGRNTIRLKYIVLPGINDNYADADGFLQLCEDVCAKTVVLSRDCTNVNESHFLKQKNKNTLNQNAIDILGYIASGAKSKGLEANIIQRLFNSDEMSRLDAAINCTQRKR